MEFHDVGFHIRPIFTETAASVSLSLDMDVSTDVSTKVSVETSPPKYRANRHYLSNRPPLLTNPLAKLPLGAVQARGWLARQIELMADGLTGRLYEFGPYLQPDNGWLDPCGEPAWEEAPYWFRGFYDTAVLSGDKRCLKVADQYLEVAFSSQDSDGYFGPVGLKCITGKNGAEVTDLWPHMLMIAPIIHHYENTGDERVVPFLTRFFTFCRDLPDGRFVPAEAAGNWGWGGASFGSFRPFAQYIRAGDMIPHLHWLYNKTGEGWLLDLATRFYNHIRPAWDEWLDHHAVNFPQRFAYPGIYYPQSGDPAHLEATEYWYEQQMLTWGQMPGGIFAADERIRPGCVDPRFAFETCGMIEFARSFYFLGRITGSPLYADRVEDVMLNHYPATHSPDLKAVHYLTAANQPILAGSGNQLHRNNRHGATSYVAYTPHNRCCGHNVGMGWPWFIQNMWQASSDDGLVLYLYGPNRVDAKVGKEGARVSVESVSDYPFSGKVRLEIRIPDSRERGCTFPLYMRVPDWCRRFRARINDYHVEQSPSSGSYLRIQRTWADGDTVDIEMDMAVEIKRWPRSGSASIRRGPLWYSAKIEEKWQTHRDLGQDRYKQIHEWPNWEVLPNSPWNYGLSLPEEDAEFDAEFKVTEGNTGTDEPWTKDNAPVEITARARRIPEWRLQNGSFVGELQQSPVKSEEPEQEISLIPLGCARLRISCFPVIGNQPHARDWAAQDETVDPKQMPVNRFEQIESSPPGKADQ